jgi:hypothetical protein
VRHPTFDQGTITPGFTDTGVSSDGFGSLDDDRVADAGGDQQRLDAEAHTLVNPGPPRALFAVDHECGHEGQEQDQRNELTHAGVTIRRRSLRSFSSSAALAAS